MEGAPRDTRQALISVARTLFAARGFYGVPIAAIADELGVSKQALLHHFSRKETLYGEVLADLSDRLMIVTRALQAKDVPAQNRYRRIAETLYRHFQQEEADSRLILRELLDNSERASRCRIWYFRGFMDALTDLAATDPIWAGAPRPAVIAAIYQIIAASNYFAVSQDTLKGMYGPNVLEDIAAIYPDTLIGPLR